MKLRLPMPVVHLLCRRLLPIRHRRAPDFIVGGETDPYLLRWWLIPRNPLFNIYLHEFRRPDDDRALHDHPWVNLSILLAGEYIEHRIDQGGVHFRHERKQGDLVARGPRAAHRVALWSREVCGENGQVRVEHLPCVTLFVTGPRVRQWSFHCAHGWRHWKEFVSSRDKGSVGRGCQ